MADSDSCASFMFGPWKLNPREIFMLRRNFIAFVNYKPVVPGHVLVSPVRVVPRFRDLTKDEVGELWAMAHEVGAVMEKRGEDAGVTAMTYVIQDGEQAGQTVPHVHVHVMPRRVGDFEDNNDIYDILENRKTERVDPTVERKPRSMEDMAAESAELRLHFPDSEPIPTPPVA